MRMWMVDPRRLCRQHLLGEHVELHMIVGSYVKGTRLDTMVEKAYIDPSKIWERHEAIVCELERRGYNHNSPLNKSICRVIKTDYQERHPEFFTSLARFGNQVELVQRCEDCAVRVVQTLNRWDDDGCQTCESKVWKGVQ